MKTGSIYWQIILFYQVGLVENLEPGSTGRERNTGNPHLWKSLPLDLRDCTSVDILRHIFLAWLLFKVPCHSTNQQD